MSTTTQVEARMILVAQMRERGMTYDEIATELGLPSRSSVHYYLNREERREANREYWRKRAEKEGCRPRPKNVSNSDRTAFKPETRAQSAMWAKLLSEARP